MKYLYHMNVFFRRASLCGVLLLPSTVLAEEAETLLQEDAPQQEVTAEPLDTKNQRLHEHISVLQKQLADAEAKLAAKGKKQDSIKDLKWLLAKAEETAARNMQEAQFTRQQLTQQIQERAGDKNELKLMEKYRQEQIKKLNSQLEDAQKEIKNLRWLITEAEVQANEHLQSSLKANQRLDIIMAAQASTAEQFNAQQSQRDEQIQAQMAEAARLKDSIDTLNQDVADITQALKDSQQATLSEKNQLKELRQQRDEEKQAALKKEEELNTQIQAAQAESSGVRNELVGALAQISALKSAATESQNVAATAEEKIKALEKTHKQQLHTLNEKQEERAKEITERIKQQQAQAEKYSKELTKTQARLSEIETENGALKDAQKAMKDKAEVDQKTWAAERKEAARREKEQAQEFEKASTDHREREAALTKNLETLKQAKVEAEAGRKMAEQQAAGKTVEVETLSKQLAHMHDTIADEQKRAMTETEAVRKESESVRNELASALTQITTLKTAASENQNVLSATEATLKELQRAHKEEVQALHAQREETAAVQSESAKRLTKLEAQLLEQTRAREEASAKANAALKEVKEAGDAAKGLTDTVANLETRLEESQALLAKAEQTSPKAFKAVSEENKQLKETVDKQGQWLRNSNKEIVDLKHALRTTYDASKQSERELKTQQAAAADSEKELNKKWSAQLEDAQKAIEALQKQLVKAEKQSMAKANAASSAKVRELEQQLKASEKLQANVRETTHNQLKQAEDLQKKLVAQINELTDNLAKAQDESSQSETASALKIEKLNRLVDRFEQELTDNHKISTDLQERLNKSEQAAVAAAQKARAEIAALKKSLGKTKGKKGDPAAASKDAVEGATPAPVPAAPAE